MRRLVAWCVVGIAVVGFVLTASTTPPAKARPGIDGIENGPIQTMAARGPLLTGIDASPPGSTAADATFFRQVRATGARFMRVAVPWNHVAPAGSTAPGGFVATDPADRAYRWQDVDRKVTSTVANGVTPFLVVFNAPAFAQTGSTPPGAGPMRPRPSDLADFATALARRYSGSFQGLPRVRHFQVWNEPNLHIYLMPQSEGGALVSPGWYRAMVNAMARAVHAVSSNNVLIAGGLAPFGGNQNDPSAPTHDQQRVRPLEFMREMLCMSRGSTPRATCNDSVEFDVWAHHPYTYGGPTHSAAHPDDVSLGDLGEMGRLVDAAKRAGHIQARGDVGFWVTEFSYDSEPGDPKGLPPALHARWTSEALYRMWNDGVGLVTWFLLRDEPFPQQFFQSGLYTTQNNAKPALRAFRFPFVAFRQKNKSVSYWGRTPAGVKAKVVVEQKAGARWKRLVTLTTNRHGIFLGKLPKVAGAGPLRAKLASGKDYSQPFSLRNVKDFRFCPWGSFC